MSLYLGNQKISGIGISGRSIIVDDELSLESENPVQNKVITNTLNNKLDTTNFLPTNTVINVKAGGTGDFTKLSDAITYLNGKWSNGRIIIQFGSGTFTEGSDITLRLTDICNIPKLDIKGNGINNTTLSYALRITTSGGFVFINNLTLEGGNSTTGTGIAYDMGASGRIDTVKVSKFYWGVKADYGSNISGKNLTITNVTNGLIANRGGKFSFDGTLTITNATNGFYVGNGGIISAADGSKSFTNVTNMQNVTNNTLTSNGIIFNNLS